MDSDALTAGSPALPGAILYPVTALLTIIILSVLAKVRSRAARFVILACWFRYILSVFHQVTFSASPLGISWNALASILVCLVGILVLQRRRFLSYFFYPIYALMVIVALSGAFNGEYAGLLGNIAKLGYLTVVCVGVVEAIAKLGEDRFMKALLWSFAPPLTFQFLSIVLNVPKASEIDGSASHIGGYNHEAVFSIVLATALMVAVPSRTLRKSLKGFFLAACVAGIFLANYRTTIIAIAPLIFIQMTAGIAHQFKRAQQGAVLIFVLSVTVVGLGVVAWTAQDRFADLGVLWNQGSEIIRPVNQFSAEERRVLSSRPYIWSQYIYGYREGSSVQLLIGFGPDAWAEEFGVYAHNTLVSYLYEYGMAGVAAIIFLWGWMFRFALRVRGPQRTKLLAAHSSFLLLNMATMPHWQIEGNILYGILCGYTLAKLASRNDVGSRAQPMRLLDPRDITPDIRNRS